MELRLASVAATATAVAVTLGIILTDQVVADQPPSSRMPVVEIVEQLEMKGYQPFTEVSFDGGYWEVEVYKQDTACELAVDAYTGEILSEHRDDAESRPPRDAQPLSKILHRLQDDGYGAICEVSFERRFWEVELLRADGKYELLVDPRSGVVISERADD